ncbi:MAG: hemerythrin domain-containing protein [Acidobacteriota bacterium]
MKSGRRHDSLIPLSREHHYGLMVCLRIHRGLPQHGSDKAWLKDRARKAVAFFETGLVAHFRAEEEVVFPAMTMFSGAAATLQQLTEEHRKLEGLIDRLRAAPVNELGGLLAEFADLLEDHIRTEERVLFPVYEEQVSPQQALRVQQAVHDLIGDAGHFTRPDLLE